MTNESISISIVTSELERLEAVEYIEAKMRKAFGCDPPRTEGIVCVARLSNELVNSKIVASLVIQGSRDDEQFSLEGHYDFESAMTPFPFKRAQIMQATRWTSNHQLASVMVIYACAELAYHTGKEYMLMEAKPSAVERIREIGMHCVPIPGAKLNLEKARIQVGEHRMEYYLNDPAPTLYMLPIASMLSACQKQIKRMYL